jgi:hypothetical protein
MIKGNNVWEGLPWRKRLTNDDNDDTDIVLTLGTVIMPQLPYYCMGIGLKQMASNFHLDFLRSYSSRSSLEGWPLCSQPSHKVLGSLQRLDIV